MTKTILTVAALALLTCPLVAMAGPDLGAHKDKRVLHFSDQEEQPYKVCNQNPNRMPITVYTGKNAKPHHVAYGECKEFKDKEISVDPPRKTDKKN